MNRKKILLVDDVRLFLEQETGFFDQNQFELVLARGGQEALRAVRELRPDLVFMDLHMPDLDGDRCCRLIKEERELGSIPVIMVTGGVDEEDFERCWRAGCDDIILKPINRHYFYAIVKKYLPAAETAPPRYLTRLRVHYRAERERLLDDYSINISTGGLFIETAKVLPVDTSLHLSFSLPDHDATISCEGRVAWVNHPEMIKNQNLPPGMGVQFVNLSLDGMQSIRSYVRGGLLPSW